MLNEREMTLMLELSITLPIKVQNGGLFISRGIGRHPAASAIVEIIFVEKGCLESTQEEECVFCVGSRESLLWPHRRHIGVEELPPILNFTGSILRQSAGQRPALADASSVLQHTQLPIRRR